MFKYANTTTLEVRPGKFPHVGWIDLTGHGVWEEVAIMTIDANGNIHFFPLNALDVIDRQRFFNIVTSRVASSFPLYDLCSQVTLGNGMNALTYFQQLVKILTVSRQILTPRPGQIGAASAPPAAMI